jgi:hypothetical protein
MNSLEGPGRLERKGSSPPDFKNVELKDGWAYINRRIEKLFESKPVPASIREVLEEMKKTLVNEERIGNGMREESWYEFV